ncbi:MAG: hypothetical protein KGH59_04930 [Candidatus Micrarchaeota archaeon]|nr:hypothetical protein [Candidatus Micrarchaeota archaeon]MDE1805093.1 hypothetical protein [Candidatus Micrarchaeota archaeon]
MAKDGKNAGASVLVLIASLLYLYVAYSGWQAIGAAGGISATSVIGAFAAVLWSIALLASIGLLFGSFATFAMGWTQMGAEMTMKGSQMGGVGLLVASVALGGAAWATWAGIVVVGFIINWIGIAMVWEAVMKK